MAHATKPVASKEKHSVHHRLDEITPADDEIEEIEIPQNKTFYDKVTHVMEKLASTRMGQMVIEKTDRVLKILEDTAKWSLPQDDKEIQLERPLPWLFFLTLIIWLRSLRIGLSLAAFVVGSQRVTPETMVYYIQIKRRRLRAIRVSGLKSIRNREIESTAKYSDSGEKVTAISKLRTLFGSAICKPGQQRDVPARRVFLQSDKEHSSKDMSERSSKRPRDDDSVDLNLTVDEMLDKYANEDSDADSDYVPNDDEDNVSTSTSCSSSSSDETEKENIEKTHDMPKETEKSTSSKHDNAPLDQSIVEVKENGGKQHRVMPKPMFDIKPEPLSDADSGNEQVQTPNQIDNTNGTDTSGQSIDSGTPTAVAQQQQQTTNTETPPTHTQLAAPHIEKDKQRSTPGHMSAASLKPVISTTASAGSPQDFHSIFHPAPIIKAHPVEANSTPKEGERNKFSSPETPEVAAANQKKPLNNTNHIKQNYHYNAKNRNKNRR